MHSTGGRAGLKFRVIGCIDTGRRGERLNVGRVPVLNIHHMAYLCSPRPPTLYHRNEFAAPD
jgi:hypothetical protein